MSQCKEGECHHQPIEEKWKENRRELESKVGEALGEASMCWSETPKGVFESNKALAVANNLISFIENLLEQERQRMSDEIQRIEERLSDSERWPIGERKRMQNTIKKVLSIINK